MTPEGNASSRDLPMLGSRQVLADFDGGDLSSDGGARRLRQTDALTASRRQFPAGCTDPRHPDLIEPTVEELIAQRVDALALGYEDLNDHDDRRPDPLLATVVGTDDPPAKTRQRERERGQAWAGTSTRNRRALTAGGADEPSRSQKITGRSRDGDQLVVPRFLQAGTRPPARIVRARDAPDDPIHGPQRGRFFPGYDMSSGSLPLARFGGDHRLGVRRRPSDRDARAGAWNQLRRIGAPIRRTGPPVQSVSRAESGFGREAIRRWCVGNGGDSGSGRTPNPRLVAARIAEREQARPRCEATKQPAWVFAALRSQTRESGRGVRRGVAKAAPRAQGPNPRFVVPSLALEARPAQPRDAADDGGRGAVEPRIKEQQWPRFADRTGVHPIRANPIRRFFSSIATGRREA